MYGDASTACVTGVLVKTGAGGGGAVLFPALQAVSRETISVASTAWYRSKQYFLRDAVVVPV